MRTVMRRSLTLLAALLALLVVAAPAGAFRLGRAPVPVAHNPADHLVDLAPDPEVYDPATHCTDKPKPGMTAFVSWLQRHADGVFWGTYRCEMWGPHAASLHAEGRAVDWHLDVSNPSARRTRSPAGWASRRSSGTARTGGPGCRTSSPTGRARTSTARSAGTWIRR